MKYNKIEIKKILTALTIVCLSACGTPSRSSQHQDRSVTSAPPREQINPQDIAGQIGKEKDSYSKNYSLDTLDIVGKCDKFQNVPKYQIYSTASEVRTLYRKLKINYPQYKDSVLNKYLSKLTTKITRVSDNAKYVDEQNSKSKREKDYDGMLSKLDEIGILFEEIKLLIKGINSGLEI